ncbi:hypothetical protein C7N43_27235 [Sphingobacteriales bacterium UPWRP_1]|nr:hypothetical protein C7N43_27235 [Sphingobacteriales bacterium UPWRP_1]
MKATNLFVIFLIIVSHCPSLFGQSDTVQIHKRGLLFNNESYKKVPLAPTLRNDNLPGEASLKTFCPTPRSQGNYGTCAAWATAYSARTIMDAIKKNWTTKAVIDSNAYSPSYTYNQIKFPYDADCSIGTYLDSTLTCITRGVGKFKDYYDFNFQCGNSSFTIDETAKKNAIMGYKRLYNLEDPPSLKIIAIKKSISEKRPVVASIAAPRSFDYAGELWVPLELPSGNSEELVTVFGGHAITIVGYNDNMFGGAFEVMNSWGLYWAKGGFTWIKYADFTEWANYSFELIDFPISAPNAIDLAGSLKFILNENVSKGLGVKDEIMQVQLRSDNNYVFQKPYPSKTRFKLFLQNKKPAYLYAICTDRTNKFSILFPHKEGLSPYFDYSESTLVLPDAGTSIVLDEVTGTDYFIVLYATEPLNIKQIASQFESTSGNINERLTKIFGEKLVLPSNVNFKSGEISFEAFSKGKSVLPIIVELIHVDSDN